MTIEVILLGNQYKDHQIQHIFHDCARNLITSYDIQNNKIFLNKDDVEYQLSFTLRELSAHPRFFKKADVVIWAFEKKEHPQFDDMMIATCQSVRKGNRNLPIILLALIEKDEVNPEITLDVSHGNSNQIIYIPYYLGAANSTLYQKNMPKIFDEVINVVMSQRLSRDKLYAEEIAEIAHQLFLNITNERLTKAFTHAPDFYAANETVLNKAGMFRGFRKKHAKQRINPYLKALETRQAKDVLCQFIRNSGDESGKQHGTSKLSLRYAVIWQIFFPMGTEKINVKERHLEKLKNPAHFKLFIEYLVTFAKQQKTPIELSQPRFPILEKFTFNNFWVKGKESESENEIELDDQPYEDPISESNQLTSLA